MSSGPLVREHGRVLAVVDEQRGSALAQDEVSGATTIHVSDVNDFDDKGGQLSINAVIYSYDSLDDSADTLHLTTGLTANTSDSTPVYLSPFVYDRWALVRVDDVYDTSEGTYAVVPFGLYASLPVGQRDQEGEEWVTLTKDGNHWVVQGVSSDVSGQLGGAAGDGIIYEEQTFTFPGIVSVTTGKPRWPALYSRTLIEVAISTGAAEGPSGAALIVDVNKGGTTVFTDQTKRPQIAAGSTYGVSGTPDVTSFGRGDLVSVDVDQVGSTAPGSDLTITLRFRLGVLGQSLLSDHGDLEGLGDDDHTQYQLRTEKGSVSGYAGLDTGTLVPAAQLGTGTADATKVLRGDRVWATPPAPSMALDDLTDVNTTGETAGQFLQLQSGIWVPHTLVHSDLGSIGVNDHHNRDHSITGSTHTSFPGGTTNFLREDGSWAAPSGGGGGGGSPGTPALTIARSNAVGAASTLVATDATIDGRNFVSPLHLRYDTPHADDDEFLGTSLGGAWTAVTPTGTATWTVKNHLLSGLINSQSANDLAAQLRAMSNSTPVVTIETALRVMGNTQSYVMAGLVFADGTSATSNAVAVILYSQSGGSYFIQMWSGTLTNMSAGVGGGSNFFGSIINIAQSYLFLKLVWSATNTWQMFWSSDGVSWTRTGDTDHSITLAPTKYGVFGSTWGGTTEMMAGFEYFRVTKM